MDDRIQAVIAPYRAQKGAALITALQKVQEQLGYLPEEAISEIAKFLGVSKNEAYGVASFYAQFRMEKQGEHLIRVCQGTACHVRGGKVILEAIEDYLGIEAGKTTPDYKFSLEKIACFGSCALGPVMVIDKTIYGKMTTAKAKNLVMQLKGGPA